MGFMPELKPEETLLPMDLTGKEGYKKMDEIEMESMRFRQKSLGAIRNDPKEDFYRLLTGALQTGIDGLGIIRRRCYPPFEAIGRNELRGLTTRVDALRMILQTLD